MIPDFAEILKTLARYKVEFVIVGGISAVLQGASVSAFDLDVVHKRSSDNIDRLSAALNDLDAHYRGHGDRKIRPEAYHLASPGYHLLMTKAGPLDIHGTIGKNHDFEELSGHTLELEDEGMKFLVLDIESLIRIKEEVMREKDKAVIPILRQTLEEKRHRHE